MGCGRGRGWGWGFCLISLTGSYTLLLCEARGCVKQRPYHHHHTIIIIIQASSAQLHKSGDRELSAVRVLLGCRQLRVRSLLSGTRGRPAHNRQQQQHSTTQQARPAHTSSRQTQILLPSFFPPIVRQIYPASFFLPFLLSFFSFFSFLFLSIFFSFFFSSLCVCVFSLSNFTQ